jgi:hypothetical protein
VSAPALRTELDALLAAVARTAEHARQGELIDLTALEEAVAGFCKRVQGAPAAEAAALRRAMVALMDELSRLDATMRQAHAALGQQLGESAQRRRAAAAYSGPAKGPR